VVLLDEIEKAHADVFNTLLQVMDDGRLTDGQGRTVDFTNTVLIMTSNIPVGSESAEAEASDAVADAELREGLLAYFKPEFVNRLDDIVRFKALSREQLSEIVEIQVAHVAARASHRGVTITLTDDARRLLGNLGYDPAYGARPLRRVIQRQLTDKLALALLEGRVHEGDELIVDAVDGELLLGGTGSGLAQPAPEAAVPS
jgi:ATP-dependent Clp protease ATP-binding subunit ClpB